MASDDLRTIARAVSELCLIVEEMLESRADRIGVPSAAAVHVQASLDDLRRELAAARAANATSPAPEIPAGPAESARAAESIINTLDPAAFLRYIRGARVSEIERLRIARERVERVSELLGPLLAGRPEERDAPAA